MTSKEIGFYPRVSLGFARKIDTDLIAFTRNVITLMTTNPDYPTPAPALALVTTSVNQFETAVHDALDGGKLALATRNACRIALLTLLRQLAAYVTGNCDTDLVKLIGSGFDAVRAPSPVGTLPAPGNLRLNYTGMSGEVLAKFDRVSNSNNYSLQSANSSDGPWQDEGMCTKARATIDGLTVGKTYWVRCSANGSQGPSPWSSAISIMVV
ncbi:MAG: fibronectin type III domain-containing protein [Acidobacteriota bacterium]|nr:fibronectin type III domain-containing protein [Acidobacteriota bacterium]